MWYTVYVRLLRYPSAFSLQFSSCFMTAATNRARFDSLQVFVKKATEVPVLSFWCETREFAEWGACAAVQDSS